MARYFTSDLHFFHTTIVEQTERKLKVSQENHVEWLLDIINHQVTKKDTLVSLGDFSFANAAKTASLVHQISCQNILFISGNHDNFQPKQQRIWYKEISIGGVMTVLSHFAFESWHKQHKGSFHLHGHSHGNLPPRGRRLDVGLDNAFKVLGEHRLFTEDEIYRLLAYTSVKVADTHRSHVGENSNNC